MVVGRVLRCIYKIICYVLSFYASIDATVAFGTGNSEASGTSGSDMTTNLVVFAAGMKCCSVPTQEHNFFAS